MILAFYGLVMAVVDVACRFCGSIKDVRRHGKGSTGNQRYRCLSCRKTFHLEYCYEAWKPGVKEQLLELAMNNAGIRDTARVLKVGCNTVLRTLKNSDQDK